MPSGAAPSGSNRSSFPLSDGWGECHPKYLNPTSARWAAKMDFQMQALGELPALIVDERCGMAVAARA